MLLHFWIVFIAVRLASETANWLYQFENIHQTVLLIVVCLFILTTKTSEHYFGF